MPQDHSRLICTILSAILVSAAPLHVGSMALHNVLHGERFENRRSGNSEQPSHSLKQDDSSIIVISQLQAVVAADGIHAFVPEVRAHVTP
jgi:hypothetical protein